MMFIKIQTVTNGSLKSLQECNITELETIISVAKTTLKEKEMDMLIEDFIGAFNVLQEKGARITVNNHAGCIDIYDADDFDFDWED